MRKHDWPEQLARHIAEHRNTPFAWGKHDCCLFAADGVLAMTGVDPMAAFRGKYFDQVSAAQALRDIGDGTLAETVTGILGTPVSVKLARRGDVVMTRTATGPAAGLCAGISSWFAGPDGLTVVPTAKCLAAWRVD